MKVKDLKPAGYNPRKITDKKLDMLGKSMKEYGDLSGIIFNRQTGNLIGGHQRIKHLNPDWEVVKDKQGEGYIETPLGNWVYREVDWPLKKEMAANVAANKHGGEFDYIKLKDLIVEIDDGSIDIELTGFDEQELQEIFGFEGKQGLTDDDEVPEVKEPISKIGDLWLLGEHRVLCGDCTIKENIERLMDGKKADMVFTDPPYGVDYDGGVQTPRKKLIGDNTTDLYIPCCDMAMKYSVSDAPLYLWHAGVHGIAAAVAAAAAAAGWKIRCEIIWNKNQAQYGALSAQYKQKHEPLYYCFKRGKSSRWEGPTTEVTVWDMKRESKNEYHPTQKPVELAERAIKNHNAKIILDLFLGSGSTLIACEKTSRICYGMEICENYCDVIVKRWENFTGKKAILERP